MLATFLEEEVCAVTARTTEETDVQISEEIWQKTKVNVIWLKSCKRSVLHILMNFLKGVAQLALSKVVRMGNLHLQSRFKSHLQTFQIVGKT